MDSAKSLKSGHLDVTKGPILVRMIKFAIPVFISGVLQQAFNTADAVIIGRFAGSTALGGISATGSIINLLINFFMGLSVGAAIAISQHLGAGDDDGAGRHAHNAIATSLVCGFAIAIIGNIYCAPILKLMNTPARIMGYSEKYIRIYFAGAPAILLYNYGSAIMRAMGDTKRPLFYLAIGGVANVLLNLLFVIGFGMDTDGVAIATIVSNIISSAFVLYNLCNSTHVCRINLKEIKIRKREFKRIMSLGLPTGVQSAMFSVSNMVMQSSINSFGSDFVIGSGASDNLDKYINFIGDAFVQAVLTFGGQNFGAGNCKRIKKIFIESLLCVFGFVAFVSALLVIFRYPLINIFITDNPPAVEAASMKIINVGGCYAICAVMSVASANVRAMGKSLISMIGTIVGVCVIRVIWIMTIFPINPTPQMLFVIYPASWVITSVFHICTFVILYNRISSGKMKMGI